MPLSCASPWEHHCLSVLHIVFQANFANGSAAMVNRYWQGYLGGICLEQLHCCLDLADTVSTCANRMLSFSDPPMEDLQALEWEIGRALAMANYHRRISCSYWKDMDPKSFTFILANLYERPIPSNFFLDLRISIFKCDWISSPTQWPMLLRCAYVHALQHTHPLNKTAQWYNYMHFCGFDFSSISTVHCISKHDT